jgi:MFS family permease
VRCRLFNWRCLTCRDLQPERRTTGACSGGWSLDALDVQIFSLVIPSLLALWKITAGHAGELANAAGFRVRRLAGRRPADRHGRVRMRQVTIVWYAVFTFLCGFAQAFNQLFIFRALQGLASPRRDRLSPGSRLPRR